MTMTPESRVRKFKLPEHRGIKKASKRAYRARRAFKDSTRKH